MIGTYETSDPVASAGGTDSPGLGRYGERFWTFEAPGTGLIRFDALLTVNTNTPDYLAPVKIDVLNDVGSSIGSVEYEADGHDTVWFVQEGEFYSVVVYSDNESWAPYFVYRLRAGGITGADSVRVPEVMVGGDVDTDQTTGGWTFIHSPSYTHPGLDRDAVVCAWQHARRRHDSTPGPFWTGACPTLVLNDFTVGDSTGTVGDSGVGTGTIGWRYRVEADDVLIAGNMDFAVYMPYAHMVPSALVDFYAVDLLGNLEGAPYVSVQELYGDDVLVMVDPTPDERAFDISGMEVIGATDDDAVIGGVGAGNTRWYWGHDETPATDSLNTVSLGGLIAGNFGSALWEPINPEADSFLAVGVNEQTSSDGPPKINATDDIPLTSADYTVSGTISGQYVKWRAYLQPREFLIYRRPPPAGGLPKPPRLRHLNIAPDRRGENWRGTSLRRISSYQ